jgi:hypothetical protein
MPDAPFTNNAANPRDDVVRGRADGLVDDEQAVKGIRLQRILDVCVLCGSVW